MRNFLPQTVAVCMAVAMSILTSSAIADGPLRLYAAGSLKSAMTDVAAAYEKTYGIPVDLTFGPSGLLRQRIEKGEAAHVFASANMKHPQTLMKAERGGPVALFARNKLCALAQPAVEVTSDSLLNTMLDAGLRLGTSTPNADPSGDYAWELFEKADKIKPGAAAALDKKALKLTGGPDSAKAPKGRNQYGWVMESGKADIFLTYCTNAVLARKDVPGLKIVTIPPALSVGADYGLIVLKDAPAEAARLALYILSPAGQNILASYGFEAAAVPGNP